MAKPVDVIPAVTIAVNEQRWQCQVCLELEGPDAGKYLGVAVETTSLDTLVTIHMYRVLDCLHAIIRQVLYKELPLKNAGEDVKFSRDYAQAHGVKSPL